MTPEQELKLIRKMEDHHMFVMAELDKLMGLVNTAAQTVIRDPEQLAGRLEHVIKDAE